jgi:hypothetical protein
MSALAGSPLPKGAQLAEPVTLIVADWGGRRCADLTLYVDCFAHAHPDEGERLMHLLSALVGYEVESIRCTIAGADQALARCFPLKEWPSYLGG